VEFGVSPLINMSSFKDIVASTKPTLIDFYADWCGPCKMMPPILDEVRKKLGDSVRILKIDVDKNPELSGQLQIQGVPTLAIFKEGKVVWRQSGVIPAHQLVPIIKTHF
jgi:thioredoxin 1